MSTPKQFPSLTLVVGLLLLGGAIGCSSSTAPIIGTNVDKRVYLVKGQDVDQPPEIIGGYAEVERMQSYPEAAKEDGAYGVIWLQFTVSAGGQATRVQLSRGGHPALETEALNIVQRLDFRPARKDGAPVQAVAQLPVIFQGPYARPESEDAGSAEGAESKDAEAEKESEG